MKNLKVYVFVIDENNVVKNEYNEKEF